MIILIIYHVRQNVQLIGSPDTKNGNRQRFCLRLLITRFQIPGHRLFGTIFFVFCFLRKLIDERAMGAILVTTRDLKFLG